MQSDACQVCAGTGRITVTTGCGSTYASLETDCPMCRTMTAEKDRVARGVTTAQEIEDLLAEAINDSLDVDWTGRDGARAVMQALVDQGMAIVEVPPPFNRGDECPNYPGHSCQVDTSMESGPNNCFHCERPMR